MRWPAVMRAAATSACRWRDPGACLVRSAAATSAGSGGTSSQVCRHAGADPADCCRFRAWSRRYVVRLCRTGGLFVPGDAEGLQALDGVRIFLSRLVRLACQAGPRLR